MDIYHIINRGVDNRNIVADTQDCARFVHDLYEFNDVFPAPEYQRRFLDNHVGRTTSHISNIKKRKCIIDMHAWCLMKNHYHLLVSERVEGGITLFLKKLSGYGRYFNERHKRKGILLQKSKKILINNDAHFNYIFHYIHLNPLDYKTELKNWRIRDKNDFIDVKKATKYLSDYRWSSFLDYCGNKNFPSVINKNLFGKIFQNYINSISEYLSFNEKTNQQTYDSLE